MILPNNRIQKLSPLIINQIAAGEVVTRPASVVKELLENAIDAGATQISIHIEQGGLGLIQISDNGKGIHPDDMTLAVTRHATSKLADVGELTGIDSLGFRGEALASICAVSHLTLTSSYDDTGIGQQLTLSGEAVSHAPHQITVRPIVKNRGTTVSVRDLYYNVPARRGHLKSISTEFAHIEQVVQRIAISFSDIQIELYHQGKLRLSLKHGSLKNGDLSQNLSITRLEQALNLPLANVAQPFELSLQGLVHPVVNLAASVKGWLFVEKDGLNKPSNLPRLIYINHRLVTDLAISQTLQKSARQADLQGLGVGLGYALFFDLPNDWINVNIHPSKQQVKIQPLTNILAWLNQKVVEQLKQWRADNPIQIQNLAHIAAVSDSVSHGQGKNVTPNHNQVAWVEQSDTQQKNTIAKKSLSLAGITHPFNFQANKVSENLAHYHFEPNQHFTQIEKAQVLGQITHQDIGEVSLVFYQEKFYLFKNEDVEMRDCELSFDKAISQLLLQQVIGLMLK